MKRFFIFTILALFMCGVYGQKRVFKGRTTKSSVPKPSRPKVSRQIREFRLQQHAKEHRCQVGTGLGSGGQKQQRYSGTEKYASSKVGTIPLLDRVGKENRPQPFFKKESHSISHNIPQQESPFNPSDLEGFFEIHEPLNFHQKYLLQKHQESVLGKYAIIQQLLDIRHRDPHLHSLQFGNQLEHHIVKSNNTRPENRINKNNAVQQRARAYFNKVGKRENPQEITSRHPVPQRIEIENSTIVREPSNLLQENKEFQIEQVKETMSGWKLKLREKVYKTTPKININILKDNIHTLYGDNLIIHNEQYYSNYAA